MNDLEKKLNKLPKYQLRKLADMRIQWRLLKERARLFRLVLPALNFGPGFRSVSVSIVLFVLVALIPGYAYASPSVTSGHWLFGLKRNLENIELKLKTSPEEQAVVLSKMTERRLEEAAYLAGKNKEQTEKNRMQEENIKNTINEALKFDQASQEVYEEIIDEKSQEEAAKKINAKKDNQFKALGAVAKDIGLRSEEETLDTITNAFKTVKIPLGLLRKELLPETEDGDFSPAGLLDAEAENEEGREDGAINERDRGSRMPPGQAKKFERDYEMIKQEVIELEEDFNNQDYDEVDVEALFQRLDNKLEKTEKSLGQGEMESVSDLLESTRALTDSAEHFVNSKNKDKGKPQNNKNFGNENQDEGFGDSDKGNSLKNPPGQLRKMNYDDNDEVDRNGQDDD